MAVVLKTTVGATLPGVRIPLPPPLKQYKHKQARIGPAVRDRSVEDQRVVIFDAGNVGHVAVLALRDRSGRRFGPKPDSRALGAAGGAMTVF
jgi:hypothetical protein